ncbi:hypothetical protein [Bradyrhizobium oligotrophicum]|uniref:hypothetical protein n=1 Tax=Bradyrhizobium oligotrophicum TaxID=44255 RepID=UPI0011817EDE|nr:hypothetical protein [Bradyrhizobium oligotrophicum]
MVSLRPDPTPNDVSSIRSTLLGTLTRMRPAAVIDSRHLEAKIANKRADSLTDLFLSDATLVMKGGFGLPSAGGGDGVVDIAGAETSG